MAFKVVTNFHFVAFVFAFTFAVFFVDIVESKKDVIYLPMPKQGNERFALGYCVFKNNFIYRIIAAW